MSGIQLYRVNFGEDLIEVIVSKIKKQGTDKDFSKVAVVFPGRRPSLFLLKKFAQEFGSAFYPPSIFSIEDFVQSLFEKLKGGYSLISSLDKVWLVYEIYMRHRAEIPFPDRFEDFSTFLFWGFEFVEVLEELDKELVGEESIKNLKNYLSIGEQKGVEVFLSMLDVFRNEFHEEMEKRASYSIPYMYWILNIKGIPDVSFSRIIFAGFYSFTRGEVELIKKLGEKTDVEVLFQINDVEKWRIIKEVVEQFKGELKLLGGPNKKYTTIHFYEAGDLQGELFHLGRIFNRLSSEEMEKTVIVLPKSDALIPVLLDVVLRREKNEDKGIKFNVSMGYPAERTHMFLLFDRILKLQETREKELYRVKEYLNLLEHPYIMNINFYNRYGFTQRLINSLKEFMANNLYLFASLDKIEEEFEKSKIMDEISSAENLEKKVILEHIKSIHDTFIRQFEEIKTLKELSHAFKRVMFYLINNSKLNLYPLAPDFIEKYLEALNEMESVFFKYEEFPLDLLGRIFRQFILRTRISLPGVPLEGIQILGLLETRVLKFKRVIMIDVNEGVIPAPRKYESILNPTYRKQLSLRERPYRREEEIYRYHFRRLIESADEVHLLYIQRSDISRSRFIEEIIWEMEKEKGRVLDEKEMINVLDVQVTPFQPLRDRKVEKSETVISVLRKMKFTPTHIDSYIRCPLLFYFRSILKLYPRDTFRGEVSRVDVGEGVHNVMKVLFEPCRGVEITPSEYREKVIKKVDAVMNTFFPYEDLPSEHKIMARMMARSIKIWLEHEVKSFKKMKIIALEEEMKTSLSVDGIEVFLNGRSDRIEERLMNDGGRVLRVIDYKTGSPPEIFKIEVKKDISIEELWENIKNTSKDVSLQLPFYAVLFYRNHPDIFERQKWLEVAITALRKKPSKGDDKEYKVTIKDVSEIEKYEALLCEVIREMINPDVPFTPTPNDRRCTNCDYQSICYSLE